MADTPKFDDTLPIGNEVGPKFDDTAPVSFDETEPVHPDQDIGYGASFLAGVQKGIPFNAQVAGLAGAIGGKVGGDDHSFGDLYRQARDEFNEENAKKQAANPRTAMFGNIVGTGLTAAALGPAIGEEVAISAIPKVNKALHLSRIGALQGLLTGVSESEGDLTKGELDKVVGDANTMAGVSGGLAAVGGGLLDGNKGGNFASSLVTRGAVGGLVGGLATGDEKGVLAGMAAGAGSKFVPGLKNANAGNLARVASDVKSALPGFIRYPLEQFQVNADKDFSTLRASGRDAIKNKLLTSAKDASETAIADQYSRVVHPAVEELTGLTAHTIQEIQQSTNKEAASQASAAVRQKVDEAVDLVHRIMSLKGEAGKIIEFAMKKAQDEGRSTSAVREGVLALENAIKGNRHLEVDPEVAELIGRYKQAITIPGEEATLTKKIGRKFFKDGTQETETYGVKTNGENIELAPHQAQEMAGEFPVVVDQSGKITQTVQPGAEVPDGVIAETSLHTQKVKKPDQIKQFASVPEYMQALRSIEADIEKAGPNTPLGRELSIIRKQMTEQAKKDFVPDEVEQAAFGQAKQTYRAVKEFENKYNVEEGTLNPSKVISIVEGISAEPDSAAKLAKANEFIADLSAIDPKLGETAKNKFLVLNAAKPEAPVIPEVGATAEFLGQGQRDIRADASKLSRFKNLQQLGEKTVGPEKTQQFLETADQIAARKNASMDLIRDLDVNKVIAAAQNGEKGKLSAIDTMNKLRAALHEADPVAAEKFETENKKLIRAFEAAVRLDSGEGLTGIMQQLMNRFAAVAGSVSGGTARMITGGRLKETNLGKLLEEKDVIGKAKNLATDVKKFGSATAETVRDAATILHQKGMSKSAAALERSQGAPAGARAASMFSLLQNPLMRDALEDKKENDE